MLEGLLLPRQGPINAGRRDSLARHGSSAFQAVSPLAPQLEQPAAGAARRPPYGAACGIVDMLTVDDGAGGLCRCGHEAGNQQG